MNVVCNETEFAEIQLKVRIYSKELAASHIQTWRTQPFCFLVSANLKGVPLSRLVVLQSKQSGLRQVFPARMEWYDVHKLVLSFAYLCFIQ